MFATISLVLIALSAYVLGSAALTRLFGPAALRGPERVPLAAGTGLGVLSWLVSVTSPFIPYLNPPALWSILAVLGVAGGMRLAADTRSGILTGADPDRPRGADPWTRLGTAAVILIFAAEIPVLFTPYLDGDVRGYHFLLPVRFLQDGRLTHHPEILYNFWALHAEMLYTLALGTGGEPAARGVAWLAGVLWAAAFGGFVARAFSPRTAVLAILLVLALASTSKVRIELTLSCPRRALGRTGLLTSVGSGPRMVGNSRQGEEP